jgi:hypothetical protein
MPEGSGQKQAPLSERPKKKPYVKPQIISEPIFETMALACSKLPGEGSQCHGPFGHPHSS